MLWFRILIAKLRSSDLFGSNCQGINTLCLEYLFRIFSLIFSCFWIFRNYQIIWSFLPFLIDYQLQLMSAFGHVGKGTCLSLTLLRNLLNMMLRTVQDNFWCRKSLSAIEFVEDKFIIILLIEPTQSRFFIFWRVYLKRCIFVPLIWTFTDSFVNLKRTHNMRTFWIIEHSWGIDYFLRCCMLVLKIFRAVLSYVSRLKKHIKGRFI